jgi:cupredoxin-like protein
VIPVLSAFRAVRHKTLVGIFLILALVLAGCMGGGGPEASLTVGVEGFEPTEVTVHAGKSFDLEVVNDTKAVQTVTVAGQPGLRVPPGARSQRQIDSLGPGEYKVTLEGAPFEATVRAEE